MEDWDEALLLPEGRAAQESGGTEPPALLPTRNWYAESGSAVARLGAAGASSKATTSKRDEAIMMSDGMNYVWCFGE